MSIWDANILHAHPTNGFRFAYLLWGNLFIWDCSIIIRGNFHIPYQAYHLWSLAMDFCWQNHALNSHLCHTNVLHLVLWRGISQNY